MSELSIYDISGLTTAVCALTAMGYDQPPRLGALLFLALMFWAAGMSGATQTYNTSAPDRALLLDRLLTTHLVVLPVYALLYTSRTNHSVVYRAAAGGAVAAIGIVVFAIIQRGVNSVVSIKYATRGAVVVLVAMLTLLIVPSLPQRPFSVGSSTSSMPVGNDDSTPLLLVLMFMIEALYAGIFAYVEPVGENTLDTITSAIGRVETEAPVKPTSCAPMCVGDPTIENACYEHNARLEQLYREVTQNKRNGVPEMSGMTATERACLRAHPIGSRCTFCQGNGCMRAPMPGVVCTDTAKSHEALLAAVNEESKRQTQSGFGVLTLDEQLAQAKTSNRMW
jgi:hypothetical protein